MADGATGIIPGAALDGHYTLDQEHRFIRDIKACGRAAAERDPEVSFLKKVTPYSLRRGHISLRVLAGEDIKRIADESGTSTAMVHRHYLHELDVRHELPEDFSFDGAVEVARRALRHPRTPRRRRGAVRSWFAAGRQLEACPSSAPAAVVHARPGLHWAPHGPALRIASRRPVRLSR
jgi:hypothetical protein